jgi:hypothetical protein
MGCGDIIMGWGCIIIGWGAIIIIGYEPVWIAGC